MGIGGDPIKSQFSGVYEEGKNGHSFTVVRFSSYNAISTNKRLVVRNARLRSLSEETIVRREKLTPSVVY